MWSVRSIRSVYLVLVLGEWSLACTEWRVQNVEPAQWVAATHPTEVQLERRDGPRLRLRNPTVVDSTIRGFHGADTLRVPVASVTRLAVKRTDWLETTLLIAGPPALFFGLACLAGCGY
jgi:hypothetical protein